jgi:hypothetical protein
MTRDCQPSKQGKEGIGLELGVLGAPGRTRTCNLLFRRQLLCPLSYRGRRAAGYQPCPPGIGAAAATSAPAGATTDPGGPAPRPAGR